MQYLSLEKKISLETKTKPIKIRSNFKYYDPKTAQILPIQNHFCLFGFNFEGLGFKKGSKCEHFNDEI